MALIVMCVELCDQDFYLAEYAFANVNRRVTVKIKTVAWFKGFNTAKVNESCLEIWDVVDGVHHVIEQLPMRGAPLA